MFDLLTEASSSGSTSSGSGSGSPGASANSACGGFQLVSLKLLTRVPPDVAQTLSYGAKRHHVRDVVNMYRCRCRVLLLVV